MVWKESNDYVAQCLNIDVSSFGKTKDEALKNLNEAIELYMEDASLDDLNKIEAPEIIYSQIEHA
ncbi:MAG: type II toxin-antitoxin system HicB family antitoxin [Chitinophagaceae bacterium]|nr:type II toxin-antitoxin system HicB family antitoxin [Chitinophagaceae bacterium]